MMVYQYKQSKIIASYGTDILLTMVFFVTLFQLWQDPGNKILQKMAVFIPFLLILDLLTLKEPTKITDDGEKITFHAFNRNRAYKWEDITQFRVKQFRMSDRILVQIGNEVISGRYWFNTNSISNGQELLDKLLSHEKKMKK